MSKLEQNQSPAEQTYKSLFAPKLEVTIPEYITEILIRNFLVWQKKPMPTSAFWRKNIAEKNENLADLTKRFIAELTVVKNLIKVFSPSVVARYFAENKCVGYRMVKKETRLKILEGLFESQLAYNKSVFVGSPKELEAMEDKREFTKVKASFGNNKMSKLDG